VTGTAVKIWASCTAERQPGGFPRSCSWAWAGDDPDEALDAVKTHIGPGHPITVTIQVAGELAPGAPLAGEASFAMVPVSGEPFHRGPAPERAARRKPGPDGWADT
jgi:hypothetical protein